MAGMKKAQLQAKAQKFFHKLSPASWFSRKKEEKAPPMPQLDPEIERKFSNMKIGFMIGGRIPVSRKYEKGRTGEAQEKMDVADAVVARAKDSFAAMESASKGARPLDEHLYGQYHSGATHNVQDAIKLYTYVAALLPDGSDLKGRATGKIEECKALQEAIIKLSINSLAGRNAGKSASNAGIQKSDRKMAWFASLADGNACLSEAKSKYDSMFEMVRSRPACPSEKLLGKYELVRASALQAESAYKKARNLSARDSDAFDEAVALLSQSRRLMQRAFELSFNSQILEAAPIVLKHDAMTYPYLSGKAQKSAISLLEMLERNAPLAEILTEFTPYAGFSSTAKREAHKLFRIMGETPIFEPYIKKIIKEYCEAVAARKE